MFFFCLGNLAISGMIFFVTPGRFYCFGATTVVTIFSVIVISIVLNGIEREILACRRDEFPSAITLRG